MRGWWRKELASCLTTVSHLDPSRSCDPEPNQSYGLKRGINAEETSALGGTKPIPTLISPPHRPPNSRAKIPASLLPPFACHRFSHRRRHHPWLQSRYCRFFPGCEDSFRIEDYRESSAVRGPSQVGPWVLFLLPFTSRSIVRTLALETSFFPGSIAVWDGASCLLGRDLPREQRTTQTLIPTIRTLLAEVGWEPNQLELIAVSQGPGSFTGLRVGLTTAKTLAYALDTQLLGVSTFAVLAQQVAIATSTLWTVIDAQRQEIFCQAFSATRGRWEPKQAAQILGVDTWLNQLQAGDWVTGPIVERLEPRLPAQTCLAPPAARLPLATTCGQLALQQFLAGERQDAFALSPIYGRPSAAEEKARASESV